MIEPMKNMLLLSNSRMPGTGYLEHALVAIAEALGRAKKVVLIPYASVAAHGGPAHDAHDAWDATAYNVRQALSSLNLEIVAIHELNHSAQALSEADAIMVNGGNTFNLLHQLRKRELIVPLRAQIVAGTPYVGWSAGSAICAPTIRTTNDMPIIDPAGLDALGVIDFQLNAHYTNAVPEGWMGETRDQRLAEFVALNPTVPVFGLPEGDWLRVRGETITLHGPFAAKWFRAGREPATAEREMQLLL
jgi:dipeptidase E